MKKHKSPSNSHIQSSSSSSNEGFRNFNSDYYNHRVNQPKQGGSIVDFVKHNSDPVPAELNKARSVKINPCNTHRMKVYMKVADAEGETNKPTSCVQLDKRKKQITFIDPLHAKISSTTNNCSSSKRSDASTVPHNKSYTFDGVFTHEDANVDISALVLADPIASVIQGVDACVLTYGAPKTGKSNSMFAIDSEKRNVGLVPTGISWLYKCLEEEKERSGARFSIRLSAFEVRGRRELFKNLLTSSSHRTSSDPIQVRAPNAVKAASYLEQALHSRLRHSASESQSRLGNAGEPQSHPEATTAPEANGANAGTNSADDSPQQQNRKADSCLSGKAHFVFTIHVYQYRVEHNGIGSAVAGRQSCLHFVDLCLGAVEEAKTAQQPPSDYPAASAATTTTPTDLPSTLTSAPTGGCSGSPSKSFKPKDCQFASMTSALLGMACRQRHSYHQHKSAQMGGFLLEMSEHVACRVVLLAHTLLPSSACCPTRHTETIQVVRMASKMMKLSKRSNAQKPMNGSSSKYLFRDETAKHNGRVRMKCKVVNGQKRGMRSKSSIASLTGSECTSDSELSCATVIYRGRKNFLMEGSRTNIFKRRQKFAQIHESEEDSSQYAGSNNMLQGSGENSGNSARRTQAWQRKAVRNAVEMLSTQNELWVDGPKAYFDPNDTRKESADHQSGIREALADPMCTSTMGGRANPMSESSEELMKDIEPPPMPCQPVRICSKEGCKLIAALGKMDKTKSTQNEMVNVSKMYHKLKQLNYPTKAPFDTQLRYTDKPMHTKEDLCGCEGQANTDGNIPRENGAHFTRIAEWIKSVSDGKVPTHDSSYCEHLLKNGIPEHLLYPENQLQSHMLRSGTLNKKNKKSFKNFIDENCARGGSMPREVSRRDKTIHYGEQIMPQAHDCYANENQYCNLTFDKSTKPSLWQNLKQIPTGYAENLYNSVPSSPIRLRNGQPTYAVPSNLINHNMNGNSDRCRSSSVESSKSLQVSQEGTPVNAIRHVNQSQNRSKTRDGTKILNFLSSPIFNRKKIKPMLQKLDLIKPVVPAHHPPMNDTVSSVQSPSAILKKLPYDTSRIQQMCVDKSKIPPAVQRTGDITVKLPLLTNKRESVHSSSGHGSEGSGSGYQHLYQFNFNHSQGKGNPSLDQVNDSRGMMSDMVGSRALKQEVEEKLDINAGSSIAQNQTVQNQNVRFDLKSYLILNNQRTRANYGGGHTSSGYESILRDSELSSHGDSTSEGSFNGLTQESGKNGCSGNGVEQSVGGGVGDGANAQPCPHHPTPSMSGCEEADTRTIIVDSSSGRHRTRQSIDTTQNDASLMTSQTTSSSSASRRSHSAPPKSDVSNSDASMNASDSPNSVIPAPLTLNDHLNSLSDLMQSLNLEMDNQSLPIDRHQQIIEQMQYEKIYDCLAQQELLKMELSTIRDYLSVHNIDCNFNLTVAETMNPDDLNFFDALRSETEALSTHVDNCKSLINAIRMENTLQ